LASTARNLTSERARQLDAGWVLMLSYAFGIGFLVRAMVVVGSDFPLNDGGMFYTMIRELQAGHYAMPVQTAYNAAHIPFLYPPLAFYAAGLIADWTRLTLLDVLRYLPLAASWLTLVAFFFLSRDLLAGQRAKIIISVFAFALLPAAFQWQLMGGGLTRSPGYLFALLALQQAYRMYTRPAIRHVALTATFYALTVLTHPEAAWFVTYSLVVFMIAFGRNRPGLLRTLLVLGLTAVVTAPWWLSVAARMGLGNLLPPSMSGAPIWGGVATLFLWMNPTREAIFPVLGGLAILGLLKSLSERQFFLPGWLLTIFLLQARAPDQRAAVPIALLASVGIVDVLIPLLNSIGHQADELPAAGKDGRPRLLRSWAARLALLAMIAYCAVAANYGDSMTLVPLSRDERAAMQWVAANTTSDSQFLVITSERWELNRSSEWFPALAGRPSLSTPQGREWLGNFSGWTERDTVLQRCSHADAGCVEDWAATQGANFTHIYLPKRAAVGATPEQEDGWCCQTLRLSLAGNPGYQEVYDGPGAIIFERRGFSS
jgi:hypothetical protein